jgi:hypothetical protein
VAINHDEVEFAGLTRKKKNCRTFFFSKMAHDNLSGKRCKMKRKNNGYPILPSMEEIDGHELKYKK